MNPNITHLAYILDRSGSMSGMEEAAVAAFNAFLKSQLDVPGERPPHPRSLRRPIRNAGRLRARGASVSS